MFLNDRKIHFTDKVENDNFADALEDKFCDWHKFCDWEILYSLKLI